ncbi:MAG: insulinase family protein [Alphaproteobacteria bacterium]|nr:insulinase family protein [Alphaproteobacteria bacterium]
MRPSPVLAMLGLLALPAVASAERLERPPMDLQLDSYAIDLRDYNFPSGLRIIFQEDHTQPIVSITAVVDRGSSHDPVGKEGIAHLVEHLWFRSVQGEDLPKVWDMLKELGANLNASTAQDWTNYMTVAPKEALLPLLELEAFRIGGAVNGVEEEIVFTEREIVRNELRMRYENTDGSALNYVWDKLYPQGHPYSRLGIGTHDSLNNIGLADVQKFVDDNYTPENTTIVVVGDFDVEDSWKFIQETFPPELLVDPENPDAPIELREPPVRVSGVAEEPPPPASTEVTYHKGGTEKTTVLLAWSLPGAYRSNEPLMNATVNMLNWFLYPYIDPDWDPLTDDLEDQSGFGCFMWGAEVNSTAMCFIEIGADRDPEEVAEDALDGLYELWDVNNKPFQTYIFGLSRYASMAQIFRSVEVVSSIGAGRATDTAQFVHFTGDPMYYSRMFEWISTINVHDATAFAQKYLTRDRAVTVVLEPYEDEDILIDSSDAIYKGAVREAETVSMIDLSEVESDTLEGIMVPPNLSDLKEYTLPNGLDVVMMPYGSAPLVRAHLVLDGGEWVEPKPGVNYMTFRWLEEDMAGQVQDINNPQIGLDPLRVAGTWSHDLGNDYQNSFGVVGSSANLDAMLYLLREYVDGLHVEVEDKRNAIKLGKKGLRSSRNTDETWWESYLTNTHLFAGHPVGYFRDEAWWDGLSEVSEADAEAWLAKLVQPANGTLYLVGRMDPTQAEAQVRKYFEGWEVKGADGQKMPLPAAPPEPPADRKIYVLNKERVSQTGARMTCQIGPATTENYEARQMLAAVLDEMAWLALREQSGVTYGAGSYQAGYPGGSALLLISSLVQNDGAGLAVETFLRLSDQAAKGDLPEDTLTLMKLAEARKYALGHQTTSQMLGRLSDPYRGNWDHINGHAERLGKVTVADLQGQMGRCNGHEVITLTGPVEVITPQLDALGVDYEVFDWKAEADRRWAEYDPKGYAKAKKKEAKEKAKEEKKNAKEEAAGGADSMADAG